MKRSVTAFSVLLSALAHPLLPTASMGQASPSTELQVFQAERAFARSLADRDRSAFAGFIADEAIFFGQSVLRGKQQILEGWSRFFEEERPPFSWAPEDVEVLPSGGLAHSSGPIYDAEGRRIGTFNTIWRLGPDGRWRVVFDRGCSCGAEG